MININYSFNLFFQFLNFGCMLLSFDTASHYFCLFSHSIYINSFICNFCDNFFLLKSRNQCYLDVNQAKFFIRDRNFDSKSGNPGKITIIQFHIVGWFLVLLLIICCYISFFSLLFLWQCVLLCLKVCVFWVLIKG